MNKSKEYSKPITLRLSSVVLEKIEKYGGSPSAFIREAISAHLAVKEKEELITSYAKALENIRSESKEINKDTFAASAVANSNDNK